MDIQREGTTSEDINHLAKAFHALKSVLRLRVLAALAEGEHNVSALEQRLRISQPLLSWHLNRLRVAGFVDSRRDGREVYYTLRREAFQMVIEEFENLLGLRGRRDGACEG